MKKLRELILRLFLYCALLIIAIYLVMPTDGVMMSLLFICLGVIILAYYKKFTWWSLAVNLLFCMYMSASDRMQMHQAGVTEGSSYAIANAFTFSLLVALTLATLFSYCLYFIFHLIFKGLWQISSPS